MIRFDANTTDLVEANVDPLRVGRNWPTGIVQLIEAHEKKHHGLVTRKQVHVLLDRYVERYFPGVTVEHKHRRTVIQLLSRRYFDRFQRYFGALIPRAKMGASAQMWRVLSSDTPDNGPVQPDQNGPKYGP